MKNYELLDQKLKGDKHTHTHTAWSSRKPSQLHGAESFKEGTRLIMCLTTKICLCCIPRRRQIKWQSCKELKITCTRIKGSHFSYRCKGSRGLVKSSYFGDGIVEFFATNKIIISQEYFYWLCWCKAESHVVDSVTFYFSLLGSHTVPHSTTHGCTHKRRRCSIRSEGCSVYPIEKLFIASSKCIQRIIMWADV
jgi:hypothetical protein